MSRIRTSCSPNARKKRGAIRRLALGGHLAFSLWELFLGAGVEASAPDYRLSFRCDASSPNDIRADSKNVRHIDTAVGPTFQYANFEQSCQ
jgi:hypothetical protein